MDVVDAIGNTPLIELKKVAKGLPNRVFIKCEHLNPGGSIKDRTARAIILDAEARGVLVPHSDPPMTIIEGTAGNTGMGFALIAASRGYRCICVIPERVAADKRIALRQLGAEVYVAKAAGIKSPDNFRNVAARLAEENGWFLTNQFHNPANLNAHYGAPGISGTGPEIWKQMGGPEGQKIGAFVSSAGTGGTITGAGKFLKEQQPDIKVVMADPYGSGLGEWVNTGELGPDGPFVIEGIGSASVPSNLHRQPLDYAEKVHDDEALAMVERLSKEEGLTVGGSTGVNVVAALRVAARKDLAGPVVTIAADLWDRYRSTAWMKAWEQRELDGVVFLQPTPKT
ncbi:MAG: pyridoxal-phosphate dependent enzyme [Kofleriaceae bacterium]|nr:pyridoxal-phosphate dependent enzyme [Kofleriaceae bacterium]